MTRTFGAVSSAFRQRGTVAQRADLDGPALVVLAPGKTVSEDELLELCRTHLAAHEVPSSVMFVDRLPRNSVGKLLRHELPAC